MYSNKEEKGIILFIVILSIIVTIKNYKRIFKYSDNINSSQNIHQNKYNKLKTISLDSFQNIKKNIKSKIYKSNKYRTRKKISFNKKDIATNKLNSKLFIFNPNTISKDSLLMLGISSKAANNWSKYLNKGGYFYSKKDITKIYGLSNSTYERIKNFMSIPSKKERNITYSNNNKYAKTKSNNIKKISYNASKNIIKIEINKCSSEDLLPLKGIGEVLSKRIIKFRDKLGGFVSINQLKEVYGLPEETFDNIKGSIYININEVKKLKINIEDSKSLNRFPYISYRLASQIIKFRKQHGFFSDKNDLLKIKSIDSLKLKKIAPYLDYAKN